MLDLAKLCVDWKLIAKRLGLSDAEVTAVDGDYRTVDEKRQVMLGKWKDKFAFRATYRVFIEALLSNGKAQDAVQACKVIGESSRH